MDITTEDLAGGITKVTLRGRLDTTGAVQLELPFNRLATERADRDAGGSVQIACRLLGSRARLRRRVNFLRS